MRNFIALLTVFVLFSCGKNDKNATESNIDPKAQGGNTCLLAYAEKYNELLTKDMVAEATGTSADVMTTGYSKIHTDTKYHEVTYSWKTGRTKKISGMDIPTEDYVRITGIEAISLDRFQMSYKAVTKEEAEALSKKTDEALSGNSDNEAVNERLKKLDEMGVSKEQQKEMLESLTNSAQKMTESFTKIENLGDASTWNTKTNTLYVLQNGVMFELVVDLGDTTKNKDVAVKTAKMILTKCK